MQQYKSQPNPSFSYSSTPTKPSPFRSKIMFFNHQHQLSSIRQKIYLNKTSQKQGIMHSSMSQLKMSKIAYKQCGKSYNQLLQKESNLILKFLRSLKFEGTQVFQINVSQITQKQATKVAACQNKQDQKINFNDQNEVHHLKTGILDIKSSINPIIQPLERPGQYFVIQSDLPLIIRQAYSLVENQSQLNISKGYLSTIDCLYYAIQKKLLLFSPVGPKAAQFYPQSIQTEMHLPNILYNIIETGMSFNQICENDTQFPLRKSGQNGEVLIMCFPYFIELFYLVPFSYNSTNRQSECKNYNPIRRLNMKYQLPNCSQPCNLLLQQPFIYFFPDNSIHLHRVSLKSGKIQKVISNPQNYFVISPLPSHKRLNENHLDIQKGASCQTNATCMSEFLFLKLKKCLLESDLGGWMYELAAKHLTKLQVKKIVGCHHRSAIACLIERKVSKFFDERIKNEKIKVKKQIVRIYCKKKPAAGANQEVWVYSDLNQSDSAQILGLDIVQNHQKQQCSILVTWSRINTLQTQIFPLKCTSKTCNVEPKQNPYAYRINQVKAPLLPISSKQYPAGLMSCIKVDFSTILLSHFHRLIQHQIGSDVFGKVTWKRECSSHLEQHIYTKNKIVTLTTDDGYFRLFQLSWADWLLSTIGNILSTKDQGGLNKRRLIEQISKHVMLANKQLKKSLIRKLREIVLLISSLIKLSLGGNRLLLKKANSKMQVRSCRNLTPNFRQLCRQLVMEYKQFFQPVIRSHLGQYNLLDIKQQLVYNMKQTRLTKKLFQVLFQKQQNLVNGEPNFKQHRQLAGQQLVSTLLSKQGMELLCGLLFQLSISNAATNVVQTMWNMRIIDIDEQMCFNAIQHLDSILQLIPKREYCCLDGQHSKVCLSPPSTFAHTHQQHQPSQPFTAIYQFRQLIFMCSTIHSQLPSCTLQTAFNLSTGYFAPYLFKQFSQNYDPSLLSYWHALIPSYLSSNNCLPFSNPSLQVQAKPLAYWLELFCIISGVTNKQKLLNIICNQIKRYQMVRQNEIMVVDRICKIPESSQQRQPWLIIPEYFLDYLSQKKKILFLDLQLAKQEENVQSAFINSQKDSRLQNMDREYACKETPFIKMFDLGTDDTYKNDQNQQILYGIGNIQLQASKP